MKNNLKDMVKEALKKEPKINPYSTIINKYKNILDEKNLKKIDLGDHFKNSNPLHLEIGSGSGSFLKKMGEDNPKTNFIGIDLRFKRLVSSANRSKDLSNVLFIKMRGEELEKVFDKASINHIYIFFPDPWPKKSQMKNRLVERNFLTKLFTILEKEGEVEIKSDHPGYFNFILKEIKASNIFKIEEETRNLYENKKIGEEATEFERLFHHQGIHINYVRLKKIV